MSRRNSLANKKIRREERERNRNVQERKRLLARVQDTGNWFTRKPQQEETNDAV